MQKIKKSASILIWSIFLSMVIGIAFVGLASKIHKDLQDNILNEVNKSTRNDISNKLKGSNFTDETFENGEKIYFENNNYLKTGLKKDENIDLYFSTGTEVNINIYDGGPIFYSFTSLDSNTNTGSGIIKSVDLVKGDLNSSDNVLKLSIKNLGGYASISLSGSNNIVNQEKNYIITKTIGNKEIIKTSGSIKND